MAKHTGLGRGFEALIPKDLDVSIMEEDKHRVQKILIQDIKPNADQPRSEFNEAALAEMVESVKRHGVIQPIIVVGPMAATKSWPESAAGVLPRLPS